MSKRMFARSTIRAVRVLTRSLVLSGAVLVWLAVFCLAWDGISALRPIKAPFDLAAVILSASAIYLGIVSIVVTVGPILAWPILRKRLREWIKVETERRLRKLEQVEKEARGRSFSILGYILGESSVKSDFSAPENEERLREAIFHCQKAYDFLKGTGLPVEFAALNNLLGYYCVLPDKSRRGFIVQAAHSLRDAAREHDAPNLLLTYAKTILTFSLDPKEIAEACTVVDEVRQHAMLSDKQKREASLLASRCESYRSRKVAYRMYSGNSDAAEVGGPVRSSKKRTLPKSTTR